MAQKANNRGKASKGVNPQGYNEDTAESMAPKSQLEQRAKKKNTKI
ncbi:small, acid-soluble spore protein L [Fredinandcohnia quinoae]|uniref:Small, acid-soluble spore protein L n=1 Tax=Fredinandcohnia quinoae TaxID=2918902 RepID=A0AAW5EDW3_9BACI|nr:small, acid-soluble spore protein L [Fredinandcohnia sp. SECRCQ15]MCH1627348.1 small, acid-soluble spore protein L [Fredinandcohnia sp. SECRCQ15]